METIILNKNMDMLKFMLYDNVKVLLGAGGAVGSALIANMDTVEQWLRMGGSLMAIILSILTSIKLIHQFVTGRKDKKTK